LSSSRVINAEKHVLAMLARIGQVLRPAQKNLLYKEGLNHKETSVYKYTTFNVLLDAVLNGIAIQ